MTGGGTVDGTGDGRATAADGVVVRERRSGEGGGGEGLRALTVGTTGLEVWKVYKGFSSAIEVPAQNTFRNSFFATN